MSRLWRGPASLTIMRGGFENATDRARNDRLAARTERVKALRALTP